MSHLGVLCQKASDSAQPWRNECGIQLPRGVGTRERACKCSLALHVCGLARGGEAEQGEGGAGAPLHLLLHGSWDCVRNCGWGNPLSLPPKVWKRCAGRGPADLLGSAQAKHGSPAGSAGDGAVVLHPTCTGPVRIVFPILPGGCCIPSSSSHDFNTTYLLPTSLHGKSTATAMVMLRLGRSHSDALGTAGRMGQTTPWNSAPLFRVVSVKGTVPLSLCLASSPGAG